VKRDTVKRDRAGALAACAAVLGALALAGAAGADDGFAWRLPQGVAPPPTPVDNPMSQAKVELGRRLFYDADLSIDGTVACGTCHEQHRAFTEGNATHPGVHETPGKRNVMGLANVAYFYPLTWADRRRDQLETQALVPLNGKDPVEMGMDGHADIMVDRLKGDDCYRQMFAAAFPNDKGEISLRNVTRALASFERTLLSFNAPYDLKQRGDLNALTASAKRGEALFFGAQFHCNACHSGPNFTDATKDLALPQGAFHNIGLYNLDSKGAYPATDHGLRDATFLPEDEGKVRTPSLRNVALTGPYMHDGSVPDLGLAVLRHYGPGPNPLRDKLLDGPAPDALQTQDILAFLYALTDTGFTSDPRFSQPKAACGKPL